MSGAESKEGSSVDKATMLRDARLARALEHAPDAHLRPDATTRAAVLAAARKAVEPAGTEVPKQGGWRSWFGASRGGRARMPWNAALASLLVAGFVTLLWRGEPVPEARIDSEQAGPATRAEVQPAAPISASRAVESSPNTAEVAQPSVAEPREAPAPVPARATRPPPRAKAPAAPPPTLASRQAPKPAPDVLPSSREVEPAEGAMADRAAEVEDARTVQNAQREASSAKLERHMGSERAKMAPQPAAGSVASALPPVPATAPPTAPPSPEPSAQARSTADGLALPADWTHVRWLPDGAAVSRVEAGQLPQVLAALRTDRGAAVQAVLGRVELQRNGQVLGRLELSAQGWRYLPDAQDQGPLSGGMDAAAAARLLGEMKKLAPGR